MNDLISRSALIEDIKECYTDEFLAEYGFDKLVEAQQTVEAKPVHGEWIRQKNSMGSWTHPTYRCSICGSGTNTDTKYCSECGASMEQWNYSKSKWE